MGREEAGGVGCEPGGPKLPAGKEGGWVGKVGCGGNSGRTALAAVPLAGVLRRDGTPFNKKSRPGQFDLFRPFKDHPPPPVGVPKTLLLVCTFRSGG